MNHPTHRSTLGRCLALGGAIVPLLLGLLWRRLSPRERLMLGLSGFLAHAVYLLGTLVPCSGWFAPVVRRFSTSHNEVWLTLDDGPEPELTPQTLELLDRHNARATFFVIGREAMRHPGLLRQIRDAGHSVANHTYSHPSGSFWCRPAWWIAKDVDRCTRAIETELHEPAMLFRPPVGMLSPAVEPVATMRGLRIIGWSVRGVDAKSGLAQEIATRVLRKVQPGSIILLHPERRRESLAALDLILEGLHDRGYHCVIPEPEQFV